MKTVLREYQDISYIYWESNGTTMALNQHIIIYSSMEINLCQYSGKGFSVHKETILAFKRVEFVSKRLRCLILRDSCCDNVLHGHASSDKQSNIKDSIYEK